MSEVTVTIEEWGEWKHMPQTKDFIESLQDERRFLLESLLVLKGEEREQAIGKVKAIDRVTDVIKQLGTKENQ